MLCGVRVVAMAMTNQISIVFRLGLEDGAVTGQVYRHGGFPYCVRVIWYMVYVCAPVNTLSVSVSADGVL